MGFMRKALFVYTGGLSGVAVKANSKKERTAKAAEKQVRLQRQAMRSAPVATRPAPAIVTGEIERLAALHASGALTDTEFADAKAKVLSS
jgi:hypothetical protein